ncbi:MAG: hypothetical protein ACR2IS_02395 [Nitrososphaeraceae archaeon]
MVVRSHIYGIKLKHDRKASHNLMPFGVLDGQKIFDWNKMVWGIAMAAAMGLFIIVYL